MHNKMPLATPRANRSTHTIKAGESLASIALRHYGDARFARLITTINKGDIPTRTDGFSDFAFVQPGQRIALPTYEEANIFCRHFFTQKSQANFDLSHYARPAMPSDSIPMDILPSQGSRTPSNMLLPLVQSLPKAVASDQKADDMHSASANQFDCQYLARRGSGEEARLEAAQQAEKIAAFEKQNGPERVFDMTPPTVSVARLQSQSAPSPQGQVLPDGPEVVVLSHYCRMIKFEVEGGQSDTVIKLQVLEETRWQTITAYIITEETSRRLAHYADKNNRAVDINLPREVAKELSMSDLKRNWQQYVQVYMNAQAKLTNFAVPQDKAALPAY
ncbi:MAG: LysM peptidoglycan-binding domain-containing protein [Cyanobacteria bacterium REEB67]|nr:LysM peptidoglycan-binding domain-containing protein [Cyanobacteria bacterium REEB67]